MKAIRNAAQERAHRRLLVSLAQQEERMRDKIAAGWSAPVIGTRGGEMREIAVNLDVEVVKWYHALGQAGMARLGAVLEAYAREMWQASPED